MHSWLRGHDVLRLCRTLGPSWLLVSKKKKKQSASLLRCHLQRFNFCIWPHVESQRNLSWTQEQSFVDALMRSIWMSIHKSCRGCCFNSSSVGSVVCACDWGTDAQLYLHQIWLFWSVLYYDAFIPSISDIPKKVSKITSLFLLIPINSNKFLLIPMENFLLWKYFATLKKTKPRNSLSLSI